MTARLAGCLSLLLLALPASAQFEGTADIRMTAHEDGNRMEGKGRLFVAPAAWRMEMEMTVAKAEKGSPAAEAMGGLVGQRMVVFGKASDPKKTWMVNEKMKTYSVVEDDEDGGVERGGEGAKEGWKVTKLGAEKVAGLACTAVRAERKGEDEVTEACLAKEISTAQWMKGMKESDDEGWILAAERAGVTGHPVRLVTRTRAGQERARFEFVAVERKRLPASLFEVPKGYRETSMMENLVQTPEHAAQMEEAKKQLEEAMKQMSPEQRKQMEEMMKGAGGKKR